MIGFSVVVGALLVGTEVSHPYVILKLLFGFVTAFTLAGASMVINDYYDREIDGINEPGRPIPSGRVTPRESLIFAAVLTILGFLAAIFTNILCLAIAIIAWIISVSYTIKGKSTGLPGNFLVSTCVAIPFFYGVYIIVERIELTSVLFAALAFLSNTGREVTKGIVDVQGDRAENVRTIAVSYGERTAVYVASAFYLSAAFLSSLPILMSLVSVWFIPFIALADIGFIASSIFLIHNHSRENARRIKNLALVWMALGLLAFLAGAPS